MRFEYGFLYANSWGLPIIRSTFRIFHSSLIYRYNFLNYARLSSRNPNIGIEIDELKNDE